MFIYLADIAFYLTWNDTVYLDMSTYTFQASADLPCDFDKTNSLILPHIDVCRLERQFAETYFPKSLQRKLQKSKAFSNDFHVSIHELRLLDEWDIFRQEQLENAARTWCNQNNIKVTAKKQ